MVGSCFEGDKDIDYFRHCNLSTHIAIYRVITSKKQKPHSK